MHVLHIGSRRPPKGGLRLRLDAAASAEKGITVFDVPGIGSPLAATRPPLLCHLRVSVHGMGDLQSQVKSSQVLLLWMDSMKVELELLLWPT